MRRMGKTFRFLVGIQKVAYLVPTVVKIPQPIYKICKLVFPASRRVGVLYYLLLFDLLNY